jgi:endonuclease IV
MRGELIKLNQQNHFNMKKDVKSLADLSEAKRQQAIEYYKHIAHATMLCQSALHSLDDVSDNIFHKREIKQTINAFITGVERFAVTFVENNNETMAQSYSNIIKQIDDFKENIKVQIQ